MESIKPPWSDSFRPLLAVADIPPPEYVVSGNLDAIFRTVLYKSPDRRLDDRLSLYLRTWECFVHHLAMTNRGRLIQQIPNILNSKSFAHHVSHILDRFPVGAITQLAFQNLVPSLRHLEILVDTTSAVVTGTPGYADFKYCGLPVAFDEPNVEEKQREALRSPYFSIVKSSELAGFKWDIVWGLIFHVIEHMCNQPGHIVTFCDFLERMCHKLCLINRYAALSLERIKLLQTHLKLECEMEVLEMPVQILVKLGSLCINIATGTPQSYHFSIPVHVATFEKALAEATHRAQALTDTLLTQS